MMRDQRK